MKDYLLAIGYNESGELDIRVDLRIRNFNYAEMKDFREMVCVAIGIAESEFLEAQPRFGDAEKKSEK